MDIPVTRKTNEKTTEKAPTTNNPQKRKAEEVEPGTARGKKKGRFTLCDCY